MITGPAGPAAKALVDERLATIAPDALRMFVAAQERAVSGSPEEWSQATTSLRRMMKEVADALYPPRAEPVEGHVLDDKHFVNRLWQFVRDRSEGDLRAVLSNRLGR